MTCGEREDVRAIQVTLNEAGFTTSQPCISRPSCFDFAARKNHDLLLIKAQTDLDSLSAYDSHELTAISDCFSSASLLVAQKIRDKPLEDDTIYFRYNILALTQKTFENAAIHNIHPLIQAGPGGYYVEIDGEAVKHRRQQLGLSVGELADMIGTSRRTLYGYERGMAKASVAIAYNLIYTLGVPVARPTDIAQRQWKRKRCLFLTAAKRVLTTNKVIIKLSMKFSGRNVTAVKRAPFDFVITGPQERTRIIGGVAKHREPNLEKRIDEILSVSRVIQAHPLLVTDGEKPKNTDISCVRYNEIYKAREPGDLVRS